MQTRSSDKNFVCLSVCLSVCQTPALYDKTKEISVQIFIPYKRSFSLVFWEEEWLDGVTTSTRNFASTGQKWKTGTGRQYFTDMSIFNHCDISGLQHYRIRWKKRKISAFLRRSRSLKVIEVGTNRKPVCDFLLLVNDIISRIPFRSYRSLLLKFWTLCVFEPPLGA